MITRSRWTGRAALLVFSLAAVCGVFLSLGAAPAAADGDPDVDGRSGERLDVRRALISDRFTLRPGQSAEMDGREPDTASIGTLWAVELGHWSIEGRRGGSVMERSPEDWYPASDKRVNIDARTANVIVASRIKRGAGDQYLGVTARHSGPVDWLGAWFDPEGWPAGGPGSGEPCPGGRERCGAIVLGAKDQSQAPDQFIELYRSRYDWPEGKKRTITLGVVGDQVRVLMDGRVVISAEFTGLGDATEVGLFSRGAGTAEFETFLASGRTRLGVFVKAVVERLRGGDGDAGDAGGPGGLIANVVSRLGR